MILINRGLGTIILYIGLSLLLWLFFVDFGYLNFSGEWWYKNVGFYKYPKKMF